MSSIPTKIDLPVNYNKITQAERRKVREQYCVQQKHLCYYCKKILVNPPIQNYKVNKSLFPPGFFDNPIHLHHNHKTGFTLGAVHAYCNAVLWQRHNE